MEHVSTSQLTRYFMAKRACRLATLAFLLLGTIALCVLPASAGSGAISVGAFSVENEVFQDYLTLSAGASVAGWPLTTYFGNGTAPSQVFNILATGSGYEIQDTVGGLCVTLSNGAGVLGTCAGASNQIFLISKQPDGSYQFQNGGQCLETPAAYQNLLSGACSTNANWILTGPTGSLSLNGAASGACGASNGANFNAAPSTNLCTVGTASLVTGSGPWNWTCAGTNGGQTASCSAKGPAACIDSNGVSHASGSSYRLTLSQTTHSVAATAAQCPYGGTQLTKTTVTQAYLCTNGTATAQGHSVSTTVNAGNPVCNPAPVNGACGASNGMKLSAAPTTNLCTAGTASSVAGTGPWTWSCNGSSNGTTASCSAQNNGTGVVTLPTLPTWTGNSIAAAGSAVGNITINQESQPLQTAPPGAIINLGANFTAVSPLSAAGTLNIYLVDANDTTVALVQNNLSNNFTGLPTTEWSGPISIVTSMIVPGVADGTYYIMLGLNEASGPIELSRGPGIIQDNQYRYYIGALRVSASARVPTPLAPVTLDLTGYKLTFDDEFAALDLSDSYTYNGAKWYTQNEQCCISPSDNAGGVMAALSSATNPFSLIPGGGLDIRLQEINNTWYSGVLTSVDNSGVGFSQQYGYFEMQAAFPKGIDTWPAFWLLNTAAKSGSAPAGEIDVVEYIANPGFSNYIRTTLHDWSNETAPAYSANIVTLPSDGNYHTYGMLWTSSTMTFYFDGTVTFQTPTPAIMHQPYYLIVDLGVGAGWPTTSTPSVNDMYIKYIRAYSLPGQ